MGLSGKRKAVAGWKWFTRPEREQERGALVLTVVGGGAELAWFELPSGCPRRGRLLYQLAQVWGRRGERKWKLKAVSKQQTMTPVQTSVPASTLFRV